MNKKILFLLLCFIMVFGVACSAEGDYYDGFIVNDDVKETGDKIPSGGQYTKKATKAVYEAGQNMPEKAAMGDVYKYGDSGLSVAVEYCESTQKFGGKKSDVFFAFDNDRLKMVTTGV